MTSLRIIRYETSDGAGYRWALLKGDRAHPIGENLVTTGDLRRSAYLKPGDRLRASIRTPDGAIDLGEQTNLVT